VFRTQDTFSGWPAVADWIEKGRERFRASDRPCISNERVEATVILAIIWFATMIPENEDENLNREAK
jgi:hypothetical protein